MPAQVAHAKTPSLNESGLPRVNGTVREDANGQLFYLNPMTEDYERAVRLKDIRQRLIQGNGQTYNIPKAHGNAHGKEPLNYTSFLSQDQQHGPERGDRNPILFQLKPRDTGAEPTGYVKDNGDIVLDAFDHGIRDFGDAMPLCLSTEVEGHDIETYKRRNMKIAMYDIIARMPGAYWSGKGGKTWRPQPPRAGSVSMRATRFRMLAGCLTWKEKGDSGAKNSAIMDLMPSTVRLACKKTNSTRPFRDLTKEEQTACETAKGCRPAKASKAKRAKRALEEQEGSDDDERIGAKDVDDNSEGEDAPLPPARLIATPTIRKAASSSLNNQGRMATHKSSDLSSRGQQPEKNRKRSVREASLSEDSDGDNKRRRTNSRQDVEGFGGAPKPALVSQQIKRASLNKPPAQMRASRQDAESAVAFEEGIATARKNPQSTSDIETSHGLEYLYEDDEQGAEDDSQVWASEVLTQEDSPDDDETEHPSHLAEAVVFNVELGGSLPKRRSEGDKAANDEPEKPMGERIMKSTKAEEEAQGIPALLKTLEKVRRSTARKGLSNTKLSETMKSVARDPSTSRTWGTVASSRTSSKQAARRDASKNAPYAALEQLPFPEAQPPFAEYPLGFCGEASYPSFYQPAVPAPRALDDLTSDCEGVPSASYHGGSAQVAFDPSCEEFQSEIAAGIEAADYRFFVPINPEDIETISNALELSRADYFEKTGNLFPQDLVNCFKHEPYASQQQRMEAIFENDQIKAGNYDGDSLYNLPKWTDGFNNWQNVLDESGTKLKESTRDYKYC